MAGPSQAGRFKPRRPAKKISVGASAAAASSSAGATAPAAAAVPSSISSRSSSGRGGRGRGRGRGGSRAPTPRGTVFFTGNAPESASKAKRASSSNTIARAHAAATKSDKLTFGEPFQVEGKETTEEFVVGELDVAIGSGTVVKKEEGEDEDRVRTRVERSEQDQDSICVKFEPLVDTYDSDSSEEERRHANRPTMSDAPTSLPFPVAPLPVGIGGHERSVLYSCQQLEEYTNEQNEPVLVEIQRDNPLVSPFCDRNNATSRKQEEDSWFIVQFPTRLPPLKSTVVPDLVQSNEPVPVVSAVAPDIPQSSAADVATPCTNAHTFDDTLLSTPAGRLGKIVVYKSGRTILLMGGENGSPEIRMNVTEGLPCGFVQQAVAIDTEESTYIPLGDVKKTVVMTPDVVSALSP